jgi:hypothetical protein
LFNQRQSEIIRAHEELIYSEALASGELRINLDGKEEEPTEPEVVDKREAETTADEVQSAESTQPIATEPKQK